MGGVHFCTRYAGLDVLSPAWHIRRDGDDRGKGGSWSLLGLSSLKDCTRTSEISRYVHTTYKPMHMYVCFIGVCTFYCTFKYIRMHSVYVYIQFV